MAFSMSDTPGFAKTGSFKGSKNSSSGSSGHFLLVALTPFLAQPLKKGAFESNDILSDSV
jgi:hypothetical protein